jgi:plasmid stabilization system protein ParE
MPRRRFRVQWAEVAVRDLEDLVAFVAIDSQGDAERVLRRIEIRAASLEVAPQRGRVVPELARFGMRAWREIISRPYRILYRIEGDTVTVLAAFDGRRDLEDVLLDRLVRIP